MKQIVLLINFTLVSILACAQTHLESDSCKVSISIEACKQKYKVSDIKFVYLVIHNNGDSSISVPKSIYVGSVDDHLSDLIFEVEKMNNRSAVYEAFVSERNDYDYFNDVNEEVMIQPGGSVVSKEDIEMVFCLNSKGLYRIRAKMKMKNQKNCQMIYSPWTTLRVI